jgi:hypothetical protein
MTGPRHGPERMQVGLWHLGSRRPLNAARLMLSGPLPADSEALQLSLELREFDGSGWLHRRPLTA